MIETIAELQLRMPAGVSVDVYLAGTVRFVGWFDHSGIYTDDAVEENFGFRLEPGFKCAVVPEESDEKRWIAEVLL